MKTRCVIDMFCGEARVLAVKCSAKTIKLDRVCCVLFTQTERMEKSGFSLNTHWKPGQCTLSCKYVGKVCIRRVCSRKSNKSKRFQRFFPQRCCVEQSNKSTTGPYFQTQHSCSCCWASHHKMVSTNLLSEQPPALHKMLVPISHRSTMGRHSDAGWYCPAHPKGGEPVKFFHNQKTGSDEKVNGLCLCPLWGILDQEYKHFLAWDPVSLRRLYCFLLVQMVHSGRPPHLWKYQSCSK